MSKQCECQSDQVCGCGEGDENCDCDCGGHGYHSFERRFLTKAEQIEELEDYLGELKLEVQAVEEHLTDLRK